MRKSADQLYLSKEFEKVRQLVLNDVSVEADDFCKDIHTGLTKDEFNRMKFRKVGAQVFN